MRPYIIVSAIPHFDPKQLPYWDIYEREGKANSIQVGGTMAGEFTGTLDGIRRSVARPWYVLESDNRLIR